MSNKMDEIAENTQGLIRKDLLLDFDCVHAWTYNGEGKTGTKFWCYKCNGNMEMKI